MEIFSVDYWPIWLAALVMAVAAVVNVWDFSARNALTMPFFVGGAALGLCHNLGMRPDAGSGGVAAAIACALAGSLVFFGVYATGAVGAGTVKLQMGFGVWIGAVYGFDPGLYLAGAASLVVAALAVGHGAVAYLRERNQEEEARMHRFPTVPAQFIGSIGTILVAHLQRYV